MFVGVHSCSRMRRLRAKLNKFLKSTLLKYLRTQFSLGCLLYRVLRYNKRLTLSKTIPRHLRSRADTPLFLKSYTYDIQYIIYEVALVPNKTE